MKKFVGFLSSAVFMTLFIQGCYGLIGPTSSECKAGYSRSASGEVSCYDHNDQYRTYEVPSEQSYKKWRENSSN